MRKKNTLHDQMILLYLCARFFFIFFIFYRLLLNSVKIRGGKIAWHFLTWRFFCLCLLSVRFVFVIRRIIYLKKSTGVAAMIQWLLLKWFDWKNNETITRRQLMLGIGVNIIGDIDFADQCTLSFRSFFVSICITVDGSAVRFIRDTTQYKKKRRRKKTTDSSAIANRKGPD